MIRMAKIDEKLINKFVSLIFKSKAKGEKKPEVVLKMRGFLKKENKRWTTTFSDLFDAAWKKRVPKDTPKPAPASKIRDIRQLKVEVKPGVVKPGKKPVTQVIDIRQPKKERTPRDKEDYSQYDKPLNIIPERERQCAKCGDKYLQNQSHPSRMLCPKCSDRANDIPTYRSALSAEIPRKTVRKN
jgi:ribosomal protein S27AE